MDQLIFIGRGVLGLLVMVLICYLLSSNRKLIDWRLILSGLALQLIFALLVIKVPFVRAVFDYVASFFVVILDFTKKGADFVFGAWPDVAQITNGITQQPYTIGYVFAFKVLPTIIFFSGFSSLLYYLGILQLIIKGMAWVMMRTMKLTGAETLAASANVFIGQTEAPLVIRPYLENMSKSEVLCLMVGGMATIAGGVFAAYVGFLGGEDPVQRQFFATHLLTASIISAPAAITAAKLLYPQDKEITLEEQRLDIPKEKIGSNLLDAITHGTTDGLKLAVNVGAMLLVFTAMIAMINHILIHFVGSWTGLNDMIVQSTQGRFEGFSLEYILGVLFSPIAWIIGIDNQDLLVSGQLLGMKTTLNEFYAYSSLESLKSNMTNRSVIIMTYALCGFSNFASIGIQIGGIGALAPSQRQTLASFGIKALIGGTVACLMTACVAGMIVK